MFEWALSYQSFDEIQFTWNKIYNFHLIFNGRVVAAIWNLNVQGFRRYPLLVILPVQKQLIMLLDITNLYLLYMILMYHCNHKHAGL